jgi:protein-disulfide isomerase
VTNARSAKSTREKAAELRAQAEAQARRRRTIMIGGVVVSVVLVLIGTVTLFRTLQKQQDDKVAAATAPPANLSNGGILVGKPDAKVTIDLYEDFQCPACKSFEEADGAMLRKYATDGKVKLIYRPVSILDRFSTTEYSTRSLNAMAAVINASPTSFQAYHDALFANQPPENGDGLPDATLIDLAVKAGAPKAAIETPITSGKYRGWVTKVTDDFTAKVAQAGTPTVLLNGTQVKDLTPDKLKAEIDKAIAAG